MRIEYTPIHLFIKTADRNERAVLERWHNAVDTKKGWRLPHHVWAMRDLARTFPELKSDPEFINKGIALAGEMADLLRWRREAALHDNFRTGLRGYQADDAAYLSQLTAAGIFNAPRTGKTPTAIATMRAIDGSRNLVIAPASLIWNWEKEVRQWWPTAYVMVYTSGKNKMPPTEFAQQSGCNVVIVSRDLLKTKLSLFDDFRWDTCFVDEAHFLRNYKSAQSEAVYAVIADRRYAMTGTPTVNHPDNIFGILKFLQPKLYTSYWQFVGRYFEVGTDWMGHNVVGRLKPHREKELKELVGMKSVQRDRKEVMPWLPVKQYSTLTLQMDGKQLKLYKEMADTFVASDGVSGLEVDTSSIITQLMRLRQLCIDPRVLGFDSRGVKTDAILEYLESHRKPVVVMSFFTSYLKLLKPDIEKLGLKVGDINGGMSSKEKQETASAFQAGEYDVLLCNTVSAGTGFTLDRAETVIFMDKPFTPAECEQAEDRVCPVSEDRNHKHEVLTLTCKDSADERINKILENKLSLTAYINKGGREAIRALLMG